MWGDAMRSELKDFGRKIEILQCERAMTNAKLARKIGVFPQNICKLKQSKKPQIKTIYKLANAFNVPVTYFIE